MSLCCTIASEARPIPRTFPEADASHPSGAFVFVSRMHMARTRRDVLWAKQMQFFIKWLGNERIDYLHYHHSRDYLVEQDHLHLYDWRCGMYAGEPFLKRRNRRRERYAVRRQLHDNETA